MKVSDLVTHLSCGVSVMEPQPDNSRPLVWCNPRYSEITGYSLADLHGRDPRFLHSGIAPEAQSLIKSALDCGRPCVALIQIRRADDSRRWVRLDCEYTLAEGFPRLLVAELRQCSDEWHRRLSSLSPRQQRLLALLGNGYPLKQAASVLEISDRSARAYRAEMLWKLQIDSELRVLLEMQS